MTPSFFRLAALLCVCAAVACSKEPAPTPTPVIDTGGGQSADAAGLDAAEATDGAAPNGTDDAAGPVDGDHVAPVPTDGGADDQGVDPRWAPVQAELAASFVDNPMNADGMTLVVFDANDQRVFESTVGDFDPDRRIPVASASKLVSGLVLMRLIDDPDLNLNLNTTVGEVLDDWISENGLINLDQLGAFTSGLPGQKFCVRQPGVTLADCVAQMAGETLTDAPGSDFSYGSTHLHVAARVAEVATGKSWQTLFDEQLATPLGIADSELRYVTLPQMNLGTTNPLIAGGLRATTNEYVHFLRLLFHNGSVGGTELIGADSMQRFRQNLYINADIVESPLAGTTIDYRYGWASWLECEGAVATCDVVSSPGAFGFTPWVDFGNGYYAILAMEGDAESGVDASRIAQRLKPLIVDALP